MSTAGPSRMANQEPRTEGQEPRTDSQNSVLGSWFLVRSMRQALRLLGLAFLLSGCMLMSGAQDSADVIADGGNISASFVGADGRTERTLNVGMPGAALSATVIVQAERGELQVELLNPDGGVAFAVRGRPQESVSRVGTVTTDAEGLLRYRVQAVGARNGSYQVFFERAAP